MITEQQIRDAAFWEEEIICLNCGAVGKEGETECICGHLIPVSPLVAILVLDNVEDTEVPPSWLTD